MKRIGIYGGSFNPPHNGHLIVVEAVQDAMQFDRIFFIPAANPPHKNNSFLAPATARFEMTKLATKDNDRFIVSDIELQREGKSYTIDTIRQFRSIYPDDEFYLIIGIDNYLELDIWKSPEEIIREATLVVMNRPGFSSQGEKKGFQEKTIYVPVPEIGISGTDIRRRIEKGESIRYLVPQCVEEYIIEHKLYRN